MKGVFWLGILGITSLQIFSTNPCLAQSSNIITDDSLGNETSQIERNSKFKGLPVEVIRGGAQRGINLFHSFREFNVREGRGAYFFSPNAEIQNILTRVTGNNRSEILGTLGTFGNSQPNLFLINPNGILFGENASLDVQGSFVGTTANGVQFGERGVFSATNPETPALLTVNPSALFFNQINAQASIQNNSIVQVQKIPDNNPFLNPGQEIPPYSKNTFGLQVPNGKSLLLLGGNVSMDGGRLNAYGGRVELGGLTEPGTIALDINGDNFKLGFPENVKRGDVSLANGAGIYVASHGGGDIVVHAQNFKMTGESSLNAGIECGQLPSCYWEVFREFFTEEELGFDNSKAGNINVNATQIVNLNNSYILNYVKTQAIVQAGDINISTNTLIAQNEAEVSTDTYGKSKGGDLTINAQDVQLTDYYTRFFTSTDIYATGDGGNLTLSTDKLLVQNGARVSTWTDGEGKGGNLTVNALDIKLLGTINKLGPINISYQRAGLFASVGSLSTGDTGNLTINTNKLLVQDGAKVSTSTSEYSEGKVGNLTVNALDVQLIGAGAGLFTLAERDSTGSTGNLTLSTNKLLVQDGAQVRTSILGEGKGGDLSINAQDVQLIGDDAGLFSFAGYLGSTGDAGNLTLSTNKLLVQDGAVVNTNTIAEGNGGNITINAQDVQLIGVGKNGQRSGLFTEAWYSSEGDAGDLTLSTNKLLVQGGAQVSTSTFSDEGKGGNLTINWSLD